MSYMDEPERADPGDLMAYTFDRFRFTSELLIPRPDVKVYLGQVATVTPLGQVKSWIDHLGRIDTKAPPRRWIARLPALTFHLAQRITPEDVSLMVELSGPFPTLPDAQRYVLKYRRPL